MYARYALPLLGAVLASAQGEGEGYPDPPPQTLDMTKSGVLPYLPTPSAEFTGVAVNEGALISNGGQPAPNPTYTPVEGPATTQSNAAAATYMAMLPDTNFNNGTGDTVTGSITISSSPDAPGVLVHVDFHGLTNVAEFGPFVYHIHDLPVPEDGNCSATMGHLDPTNRGEYYPCDTANPSTCQVGDLAGKHGKIGVPDFVTDYSDAFLSTEMGSESFFGDKSVVIHTSNATRITCANFMMMGGGAGGSNGTMGGASGTGTQPSNPAYTGPVQTDGASVLAYSVLAVVAALVAMVV